MFHNTYNILLCNKCDINARAGGLFEEESIQKILSHLIILVHNTVLQMQWILFNVYFVIKIIVHSVRIYPNA